MSCVCQKSLFLIGQISYELIRVRIIFIFPCYTSGMAIESLDSLLTLTLTPGLGPTLTRRCIQAMGHPEAVLNAGVHHLAQVQGIGLTKAQQIRQAMDELADGKALSREKQLIEQYRVTVLTLDDPAYPRLLRLIHDPPPLLYIRGEFRQDDAVALAVVGTRRCSAYGRLQADRLAGQCAAAGLCIVSGGAYGVDAAAHLAAMRVAGRTIAVIGSGLANPYPPGHCDLFNQIAGFDPIQDTTQDLLHESLPGRGLGAVISELPMTAPPMAGNFPSRNRIISALALGVLVVEAPLRSGALITARLAVEDHHREVMALPGRVDVRTSQGCHKMIREGWATLVTSTAEILDCLGEAGQLLKSGMTRDLSQGKQEADRPEDESEAQSGQGTLQGAGVEATMFHVEHRCAGNEADGPIDLAPTIAVRNLTATHRQIYEMLSESRSLDQLVADTHLAVSDIQAGLTMLELRGLIRRDNGMFLRKQI